LSKVLANLVHRRVLADLPAPKILLRSPTEAPCGPAQVLSRLEAFLQAALLTLISSDIAQRELASVVSSEQLMDVAWKEEDFA